MNSHSELKIGATADIILDGHRAPFRTSVYDRDGDIIVLSQPTPPLGNQFVGRRVTVTYLARVEMRTLRFGFRATIDRIDSGYQLSGGTVAALVMKRSNKPDIADFRQCFRIKPAGNDGIAIQAGEQKLELIDVSLGGAGIVYRGNRNFVKGETLKITLSVGSTNFDTEARVRWIVPVESSDMQRVGVEFDRNQKMEAALGRAILEIERRKLYEGRN